MATECTNETAHGLGELLKPSVNIIQFSRNIDAPIDKSGRTGLRRGR